MDKNAIRQDVLWGRVHGSQNGSVDALKGETLFVSDFLMRTVDGFVVASTARQNNVPLASAAKVWKARKVIMIRWRDSSAEQMNVMLEY